MREIYYLTFILFIPFVVTASMENASKNGKTFGKQQSNSIIESINSINHNDILPEHEKGKIFNPKDAKNLIKTGNSNTILKAVNSEETKFLLSQDVQKNTQDKHFHPDEYFIKKGDEISEETNDYINNYESIDDIEYQYETCRQSGDPFPVSIERTLEVDVDYQPQEVKKTDICLGHKSKQKFSNKSSLHKVSSI